MDAPTVVALLALHLLASGWMLQLVGRTMVDGGGLRDFAAGALIFGSAYLARLAVGLGASPPLVVVLDTMMVGAVLLFSAGMRRFFGSAAWSRAAVLGVALAFGALQALLLWQGGPPTRFTALNGALALCYASLAWNTAGPWIAARRSDPDGAATAVGKLRSSERGPALILGSLIGLLALATAWRAGHIATTGVETMYSSTLSKVYFAYSSLVAMTLCPLVLWLVFRRLTHQLADLATHDALTRALNRHGLEEALRRHFGQRGTTPLAWLVVDIDHFKGINDAHGHGNGDKVLRSVAQVLLHHVRAGDFVARTGGEEFVVGCVAAEPEAAARLAERLRSEVEGLRVPVRTQVEPLQCTVSIGRSAPFHEMTHWEVALRDADTALYRAKAGGRNRVEGPTTAGGHPPLRVRAPELSPPPESLLASPSN